MPQVLHIETRGPALIEITQKIETLLRHSRFQNGIAHIFMPHTSASLVIQENADPDVRHDLLRFFDRLAPEDANYAHSAEGPDDMPAHIRSALTAPSLAIPFSQGRLLLGKWQGIYVFEHRRGARARRLIVSFAPEFEEIEN